MCYVVMSIFICVNNWVVYFHNLFFVINDIIITVVLPAKKQEVLAAL